MISLAKWGADAVKVNYGDLGLELGQLRSLMPTSAVVAAGALQRI